MLIDFERGGETDRHRCERETRISSLLYMPRPGIKPTTFGVRDDAPACRAARPGLQRWLSQSRRVAVSGALAWESGTSQAPGPSNPERSPTWRGPHPIQPSGLAAEARAADWEQGCLRVHRGAAPPSAPPPPCSGLGTPFSNPAGGRRQTQECLLLKWLQT